MALQRRAFLKTGTGLSIALTAGCNGIGNQHPTSEGDQSPTTTEKWATAVRPADRLVLYASRSLTVTVTMYADQSKTTEKASVTYSLNEGETRHVTEFTPDGWIVLSMDGEVIWEKQVTSADHYKLSLTEGKATISEHWEK